MSLAWTKDKPQAPGRYWYMPRYFVQGASGGYRGNASAVEIVELHEDYVHKRGPLLRNHFAGRWPDGYVRWLNGRQWMRWTGWWAGPIEPPPTPRS